MTLHELLEKIKAGEDSRTQFKVNISNVDSLAAELVAFSNAQGGILFVGIDDTDPAVYLRQPHRNY